MKKIGCYSFFACVFASLGLLSTAQAITLDDFNLNPQETVSCTALNTISARVISNSGSIGGSINLVCQKQAGSDVLEVKTGFGRAASAEGPGTRGQAVWQWDGSTSTSSGNINPLGLGQINFKEDGGTALVLQEVSFDCPGGSGATMTLQLTVYDGRDGRSATFNRVLNCATDPIDPGSPGQVLIPTLTIPYTSFTDSDPLLPVDFTKIGAVELRGFGNTFAKDLRYTNISTNGNCPLIPPVNGKVLDDCGECTGLAINPNKDSCGLCPSHPLYNNAKDSCGVCFGNNVNLDSCGICTNIPGYVPTKDQCGICGGNNTACADCLGMPNGTAVVDRCGVCGGTGTSCLDCAGTPFGTAVADACGVCGGNGTSCLGCVITNQTVTVSALNDKADEFIQNALFFLERIKKADPKYFKSAKAKIKKIEVTLNKQIVSLPLTNLNCATSLCVKSSVNANVLIEIEKLIEELYKISKTTLAKPTGKTGGKCNGSVTACKKRQQTAAKATKTLQSLAKKLYNDAKTLKASYPAESTICPDGLLK